MKIAILTNFMEFNPGYSLTMIVYDQTLMLTRRGHDVHLYVNEQFNPKGLDFSHCNVHEKIPFSHLTDYMSISDVVKEHEEPERNHKLITELTSMMLEEELADTDVVFTHDFVFTGWFLPYGLACKMAGEKLPKVRWYHWIHSMPSGMRDYWLIDLYGPMHKLVFPNYTDRLRVAEQFRGGVQHVEVVPHIKDIRTWGDFHEDTKQMIDLIPAILSSEMLQVYPAGTDRLAAKGIDKVIKIFGHLKRQGVKVCLLIANQWATGRQRKETIGPYVELARVAGLEYAKDFAFTSDLHPDWANGLPNHMVRELMQCSNLFIFPTHEESFGLVLPEALLSGHVLPVLNSSLDMQKEIIGRVGNALWFEFSSYHREFMFKSAEADIKYHSDIATIILSRIQNNESIKAFVWAKQYYNMDYLYDTVYHPLLMGSTYEAPIQPPPPPLHVVQPPDDSPMAGEATDTDSEED